MLEAVGRRFALLPLELGCYPSGAGEEAAQLVRMLEAVGRGDAAERLYCAARLPPLQRVWEGYAAGTPFASWLPGFYDHVRFGARCLLGSVVMRRCLCSALVCDACMRAALPSVPELCRPRRLMQDPMMLPDLLPPDPPLAGGASPGQSGTSCD